MSSRRVLAKLAYNVGGWLYNHIEYPQRTYAWDSAAESFTPAGRHRLDWHPALELAMTSERLDPLHWEHWALDHGECDSAPCPECAGQVCRTCSAPPDDLAKLESR